MTDTEQEDVTPGAMFKWEPDSPNLLFFLGGALAFKRENHFRRFLFATRELRINKVWLNDQNFSWYHCGVNGHSTDLQSTADYLKRIVDERNIERVCFLGVSSGGYASLLFAWMLQADAALAVSPRTYLDRENRLKFKDFKFRRNLDKLDAMPEAQREYFDLAPVLENGAANTEYHLFYSSNSEGDKIHCERLAHLPNTVMHESDQTTGHNITTDLVKNGAIFDVLREKYGLPS